MRNKSRDALRTLLLWLLLELVAAAQAQHNDGGSILVHWARNAVLPIQATASWIAHTTSDLYHGLGDMTVLVNELQETRTELDLLRAENMLLREDLAAMDEAQAVLPLAKGFSDSSRVARCNFRNLAQGTMEIQPVDGGPVPLNTAAVSGEGLVGRVVWSSRRGSTVQVLTHPAAAVAVRSMDGSVRGLLSGSGGRELNLEYVPRNAKLLRGTLLVSSGADGIYPPGIPVARVVAVRETESAFLEVAAVPTAALTRIRVVLLLPEWSTAGATEVAP